eukprot:Skav225118  [mRNA]  locus=scaffold1239:199235:199852:- [translate_table: standard]
MLRTFYFMIADGASSTPAAIAADDEAPGPVGNQLGEDDHELLEDVLPVNWQLRCEQVAMKVPVQFLTAIVDWWCDTEAQGDCIRVLSEIELVFALLLVPGFSFPFKVAATGAWIFRPPDSMFLKPTFSELLKAVQFALKGLTQAHPYLSVHLPPSADPAIGVCKCFRRVKLCISDDHHRRIRSRVVSFTQHRPIRRICDLARPVN